MAWPATAIRRTTALSVLILALVAAGCGQYGDRLGSARASDPGPAGSAAPAAAARTVPERAVRAAPPVKGTDSWSGESGASGHPAMQADAVRKAAAAFPACLASFWPDAQRRGISRASFVTHTASLTPDLGIMDLLDRQPEFTRPVWEYLDILVTDARIRRGRELLAEHRALFDAVERSYGVDRHVIAAIWGVESNYGTRTGERPVLRSTATLSCVGRRQDYFRDEFLAALEIVHRGDIRPEQFNGSWAGAFGATQFMPTTFRRHAVDFDGDGRRDLVGSVPDAVASTANKLRQSGWRQGETWGYEVSIPQGFDYRLAGRERSLTIREWERHGVRRPDGSSFPQPNPQGFLLLPAGAQGPAFVMLANFRAVMRYNPAESYALAIGHLADRLRGGGSFMQNWPRHERMLSRAERQELQQHLARLGYDVGVPDGRFGPKTLVALRDFQQRAGKAPDGFASTAVLEALRQS